jgi:SAM-dependent methyltransferase
MPDEAYWESLFDVPLILSRLCIAQYHDVAELGCGYGTFSIPVAKAIRGTLYTFDIDDEMVARTKERVGDRRIVCAHRDVMESGFGVRVDAVMLFNILHCERPIELLKHAAATGGDVLVIHWRHADTPRGPSLEIRPRPEQIINWGREAGLTLRGGVTDLPPWHFGLTFSRTSN